jgi:Calcineurin-like phosphoesterase/Purple acid Phosphatase, N-terminal domain/FG-GAP-like repeat
VKKSYDYLAGVKYSLTKARMFSVWRLVLLFASAVALCDSNVGLAQTVTRGPYLQLGSSTGVVIRWRTDLPTNSRVRYGASPSTLTNIAGPSTVRTEHAVRLTGLTPGTLYYYSIGSTTQVLAGGDSGHFFVTAPTPGVAQPTRIWVIGDSGTADANAAAVRDAYLNFTGTRHTDLWLMLGDNAYESGTDAEYQNAVFNMYPTLLRQSVLWPTLSNHDSVSSDSATQTGPYYDIFSLPRNAEAGGVASGTEAYYSFDFGNIHFIVLDSSESSRAPNGAMLTWLTSDLAATTQPWIIAYWHHAPYSNAADGFHNSDTNPRQKEMRQNVLPILEAGGVDLVLTGHAHWYQRSYLIDGHYGLSSSFTAGMKVDGGSGRVDDTGPYEKSALDAVPHEGAVYIVAGSSGKLDPALNHPTNFILLDKLGSLVLDIDGNRLDARFIDDTGVVGDYFTIMKGGTTQKPQVDFDGNKKSDVVVFRGGAWLFHDFTTGAQNSGVWTGSDAGCLPLAMDYDGDGKTDFTQFCNGAWHFYNSNGSFNKGIWTGGVVGDWPVPADYDGDGKDDVVVYRGGAWLFYNFTTGAFDAAKSQWTGGGGSCIPAPMDYDGDGTADFTQLCNGTWHFYNDNGSYNKGIWTGGVAGDLPVPADYDGNGTDDVVVFRGGAWLFYDFATGAFDSTKSTWTGAPPHFTGGTSLPAPLDHDGDGKADFTVYSGGLWHFFNSDGTYNKGIWTGGVAGDQALSRRLLP